jgi:uncharacterized protein YxjI
MRYQMQRKQFMSGEDFTIQDETGNNAFYVKSEGESSKRVISFQTADRVELVTIRQQVFSWGPTFEIYLAGKLYAMVKNKLFSFFNCTFTIDVPGPNDLHAQGEFADYEYSFSRNGMLVATVSKQWSEVDSLYGVNITPYEDDILVLAYTVVVDMACYCRDDETAFGQIGQDS